MCAARRGHARVVAQLISAGAQLEAKDDVEATALHHAASQRDSIALLVQHGALIDARSTNGSTPLSNAASSGCDNAVALLISLGAELETKDNDGWTALAKAAYFGHDKCAVALLAAGADPDHLDHYGRTALSRATPQVLKALADMRVSRADALAALEAISEHLLPDVADVVMLHRYIYIRTWGWRGRWRPAGWPGARPRQGRRR